MTQLLLESMRPVMTLPLDDARWKALTERRREPAAAFVYAVATTGVYCVPWCASRRPRRENVQFFETPAAAERAGYRACKRCRPAEAPESARRLEEACRLLAELPHGSSAEVAAQIGLSPFYFQRFFKRQLGITPGAYRRRVLAERAKSALPAAGSVTEAIFDAGYGASSRFYAQAARELGMPPSAARSGARGEAVQYTVRPCAYGRVLIAFTTRGVCAVTLGDEERELIEQLSRRYPKARVVHSDCPEWVAHVLDAIDNPGLQDIPLDIRGTAFQERVWSELRRIPAGETRSYAQIAAAVGDPRAVRAVARACAENRVAVLIPCHRVVRSDGKLSGYRWGVERKRKLLERERG